MCRYVLKKWDVQGWDYTSKVWSLPLLYFVLGVLGHKLMQLVSSAEVDIIGEQQLMQMQSGSSSWCRCSWGTAAEADTIGEQQLKRLKLLVTTTFMIHTHKIYACLGGENWSGCSIHYDFVWLVGRILVLYQIIMVSTSDWLLLTLFPKLTWQHQP